MTDREDPDPAIERARPHRLHLGVWEAAHRPTKLAEVELARLLWRRRQGGESVKYYERALQKPVRGDDYAEWARELAQIFTAEGRQSGADDLNRKARDVERKWGDLP